MSLTQTGYDWDKISFPSTLFLCTILDTLLSNVPYKWQAEVRLGLQEALVNASKHGNNLDPNKKVVVFFSFVGDECWWIICDEGSGFCPPKGSHHQLANCVPELEAESGRGVSILHQIFDRVVWNRQGTELRLCKFLSKNSDREPLFL
jgi:anti-sigma regulatory factor (Ser/Thr protein kinase)